MLRPPDTAGWVKLALDPVAFALATIPPLEFIVTVQYAIPVEWPQAVPPVTVVAAETMYWFSGTSTWSANFVSAAYAGATPPAPTTAAAMSATAANLQLLFILILSNALD